MYPVSLKTLIMYLYCKYAEIKLMFRLRLCYDYPFVIIKLLKYNFKNPKVLQKWHDKNERKLTVVY